MGKAKLQTNVKCNVRACKYNADGCLCNRDNINITKDINVETAHYCGSYCEKCEE